MTDVACRMAGGGDVPFILQSWLKSYRSSSFAKRITSPVYFRYQHLAVEQIIKRPTSRVLVAHPNGDPDTILGWLCHESGVGGRHVLHFAYIKLSWRGLGIFSDLLTHAGITDPASVDFTHLSNDCLPDRKSGRAGLLAKWPSSTYVPWLI